MSDASAPASAGSAWPALLAMMVRYLSMALGSLLLRHGFTSDQAASLTQDFAGAMMLIIPVVFGWLRTIEHERLKAAVTAPAPPSTPTGVHP